MKVSECMTREVRTVAPDVPLQEAARLMKELDIGSLPVARGSGLVGMVTDRDFVVRAICDGKGPQTPVGEVMSSEVKYCFDDEDVERVADNMAEIQLRRLPVVDRQKHLVGVVALADIATTASERTSGEALKGISRGA